MKVDIQYPKGKRFRKVKVTIHSKDLWCLHVTLAHIIHPIIVKYRKFARPSMDIYPDNYHDLSDEQQEKIHHEIQQKWLTMIDDMIYAFKWIKENPQFGPHDKAIHADLDKRRKEIKRLQKEEDKEIDIYSEVFDKYKTELDEHESRMKKGLRLFAEHFNSLWT